MLEAIIGAAAAVTIIVLATLFASQSRQANQLSKEVLRLTESLAGLKDVAAQATAREQAILQKPFLIHMNAEQVQELAATVVRAIQQQQETTKWKQ